MNGIEAENSEQAKGIGSSASVSGSALMPGYAIPGELDGVMKDALAADDAMAAAVKGFFKYQLRNAVMLGRIAREKKAEFWKGVYELYPDLEGKRLSYNSTAKTLKVL